MKFIGKDAVATALVAAVVVYLTNLALDGFPMTRDVTDMAAVGLIFGFASRRIGGRAEFAHERVAFASRIVALITESELVLALFIASIIGLWLAAMYAHSHAGLHRGVPVAH